MTREIRDHIVNPVNDRLSVTVTDEPGAGGANHRYIISGFNGSKNPSYFRGDPVFAAAILFQNEPISEVGVNGVTQEVLLVIVLDRLRCFQAGPFPCAENDIALSHVEQALEALKSRTLARMVRGVEGKTEA